MESYGDVRGDYCFSLDSILFSPMSTAIARIYTQDGFVVAADGRKLNRATDVVASDEVQKIFPLRHEAGEVSCAVAGLAQFVSEDGLFDFGSQASLCATAIRSRHASNLYEYSELLAQEILRKLEGFNLAPLCSGGENLTSLFLDGYIANRPMRCKILFYYTANGPRFEATPEELITGKLRAYGSKLIWAMLFATTPHGYLPVYRQTCQKGDPTTIEQAVQVTLNVVRAHCDPEALTIDPEICAAVGGRVHIAKVTPHDGFKWVREPILGG